jgi:glutamate racemase
MIGVFDSGFGGLTVLSALLAELPEYDYVYLGDNARAPYGGHSKENILKFTRAGVEFLFEKGARVVILACNSASANALRDLQGEMIREPGVKDKNILGVVVPIAEAIAEGANGASETMRIAVIGTQATVESGVYEEEVRKRVGDFEFMQKACPLLVPLIEEGWARKMETKRILKSYLREVKDWRPDVLVPACTHYPILQKEIEQVMGSGVRVLETGAIVAASLKNYLAKHPEIEGLLGRAANGKGEAGKREFYTTDSPEKFAEMGSVFLGQKIDKVGLA